MTSITRLPLHDLRSTTFSNISTAVSGDRIFADTSSGAFTITLPSSPSVGDTIRISDVSGSFATNNLTLDPTASIKIMSQSAGTTLAIDVKNLTFDLVYSGATSGWRVQ